MFFKDKRSMLKTDFIRYTSIFGLTSLTSIFDLISSGQKYLLYLTKNTSILVFFGRFLDNLMKQMLTLIVKKIAS